MLRSALVVSTGIAVAVAAGCAAQQQPAAVPQKDSLRAVDTARIGSLPSALRASPGMTGMGARELAVLNRLSWGVTPTMADQVAREGLSTWIKQQLHPPSPSGLRGTGPYTDDSVPPEIAQRIASLEVSQTPPEQLAQIVVAQRRQIIRMKGDPEAQQMARRALQRQMTQWGAQAQEKSFLLDLYSKNQLQQLATWFWLNHFNVYFPKADVRVFLADYEDTIRAHALGKFRDLLSATMHHPAMLLYLDNARNADKRINENYARELMELHTLGVDGGYTQKDVQELARILTGLGVNQTRLVPNVRPQLRAQYQRVGAFEFNPNRHDYGDKIFLGHEIRGQGPAEIEQAIDILATHPATARFISKQLATFFVSDNPPPELVTRMAETFTRTGGDIAAVLAMAFASPEFEASLGTRFKDPMHYTLSAVRLAYGETPILNVQPIRGWLARMAEPLYGHETPDGYPITKDAWSGPGAMATRFEVARAIGSSGAGLFRRDPMDAMDQPGFPQIAGPLYYEVIGPTLASATVSALKQAVSPQDWNTLFLSSPEFMRW